MDAKQRIARRVAQELRDGDIVNLGIGLPTMVANYLPEGIHITLQSENGFLGLGPVTTAHPDLVNAGGQPCGILPGAAMFDSAMSFALIRGGHIDACVLGVLQVDERSKPRELGSAWENGARYGWRDGSGDRVTQSDHRHGTLRQKMVQQKFCAAAPCHSLRNMRCICWLLNWLSFVLLTAKCGSPKLRRV